MVKNWHSGDLGKTRRKQFIYNYRETITVTRIWDGKGKDLNGEVLLIFVV